MTDTDLPDWLYVGAPVATYTNGSQGGFGQGGWSTSTVTKIGKRDIVLENGKRFNVTHYQCREGGTWGQTYILCPRTDETFLRVKRERTIYRDSHTVETLMRTWRDSHGDLESVRAAVEVLSSYLASGEESTP